MYLPTNPISIPKNNGIIYFIEMIKLLSIFQYTSLFVLLVKGNVSAGAEMRN